jgi:hypothetical protein
MLPETSRQHKKQYWAPFAINNSARRQRPACHPLPIDSLARQPVTDQIAGELVVITDAAVHGQPGEIVHQSPSRPTACLSMYIYALAYRTENARYAATGACRQGWQTKRLIMLIPLRAVWAMQRGDHTVECENLTDCYPRTAPQALPAAGSTRGAAASRWMRRRPGARRSVT